MASTNAERASWTATGSDVAAQRTYASVKAALASIEKELNVEIFLQGSYANHTNIRADSDVDIVVMMKRTFQGSVTRLGPVAKAAYNALPGATVTAQQLHSAVRAALESYYGRERVVVRNKCIKVTKSDGYVDADVVPSIQYRWYRSTNSNVHTDFVEGILITPQHGPDIINFPKEHIENGKQKNTETAGNYKPTVRQIKRLRNRAADERLLAKSDAPGYLLECMTFNVPRDVFIATDDATRLLKVMAWLKHADKKSFRSGDGIHLLFGDDPGHFDVTKAQQVLDAMWEAL